MGTTAAVELIPKRVLFGNPEQVNPQISPDGTMLAYLAPLDKVLNVWVGDRYGEGSRAVTTDTDRGVLGYFWAADNRHILYIQDIGGNENYHLYSVDLQSGQLRDLTPFEDL